MSSSWLSRLLIPAVVLGMEAAWVVPLVALGLNGLNGAAAPMTPAMTLAVLALADFGTRLLSETVRRERLVRTLTVAAAISSTAVVVWLAHYPNQPLFSMGWPVQVGRHALNLFFDAPGLAGGLVACGFLWWRGQGMATETLGFDTVFGRFRAGMLILVVYHVVGLILSGTPLVRLVTGNLAPNVLAFFFCGLLALALSRTEEERSAAAPGHSLRFNRQWGVFLLLALVGELLVASVFAALLAPEAVAFITAPLAFVGGLLLQLVLWFFIAMSYVADAIITSILWLLSLFGIGPGSRQLEILTAPVFPEEPQDPDQQPAVPEWVLAGARGSVVALVVGLALILLWRAMRRPKQAVKADGEETRESVWSWAQVRDEVFETLRALLRRLRRQGQAAAAAAAGLAGLVLDADDVSSVRGVYRAFLRAAGRAGVGRRPNQTAGEVGAAVALRVPERAADVGLMTAAYQQARYGQADGPPPDLPGMVAAWRRVQQGWERQAP